MNVDYHIEDSKFREILDILRPPIKRYRRNLCQEYIGYVISNSDEESRINIVQKLKKKLSRPKTPVKSSLSLVLEKTCKEQVFEQFPYEIKNSQAKSTQVDTESKPTIKVTIIPKKDPNTLLKFFETEIRNTQNSNKNYVTCDKENTIATKNVYLVVAGKDKDKIYEVKATGRKPFKDEPTDVTFGYKKFMSKMEKKRKTFSEANLDDQNNPEASKCNPYSKDDFNLFVEDTYPQGSSRVKIVGQIGLNEDEKYVMRCAATVNGQPVRTNYVPAHTMSTDKDVHFASRENTANPTNFRDDSYFETEMENNSRTAQIDASIQLTRVCSTADRNTQCNFCELCNTTDKSNRIEDESKVINLNRSTSPLVIISVYPKPELNTFSIDTMDLKRNDTRNYHATEMNEAVRLNTDLFKTLEITSNKVNLPVCCPCKTKKDEATIDKDDKKAINKTKFRNSVRSPSPVKKIAKSSKNKSQERKKQTLEPIKDFETSKVKSKSRSPSPNRLKTINKTTQNDANMSKQNKKISTFPNRIQVRKEQNEFPNYTSKAPDNNANTIKRESFKTVKNNPKVKFPMNKNGDVQRFGTASRKFYPKTEISKISVNIDSDREFYDVVYEKKNVSTDLTIKRTVKDSFTQKYFADEFENNYHNEHQADSLENFFPTPNSIQHRRSASQGFNYTENNADLSLSRIWVRDSIEIGHRRENTDTRHTKRESDAENTNNFFDNVKHFPGDDCSIDPVERDKEIRELLGISIKRPTKKHINHDAFKRKIQVHNAISSRCHVTNMLCKSIAMKPLLYWSSFPENNSNIDSIYISKRDEEKSITDDEKHNLIKLCACTNVQKQNINIENKLKIAVMTKQRSTQYIAEEMLQFQSFTKNVSSQVQHKQNKILLTRKQYRKVKKLLEKVNSDWKKGRHVWNSSFVSLRYTKARHKSKLLHYNKEVQTDSLPVHVEERKLKLNDSKNTKNKHTVVLFCKQEERTNRKMRKEIKKVASSIEIRYSSIAYNDIGDDTIEYPQNDFRYKTNLVWNRHKSIETIFRGHKKSFTPNLGTSSISLASGDAKSTTGSLSTESKPRKPFLKRLMSCLVMKSETTAVKLPVIKQKPPTMDSSIDSYHISTSLGPRDMSSSLYDTSVSFYSDHAIGVVNNKTKRGFFSSVREFLSTKKN